MSDPADPAGTTTDDDLAQRIRDVVSETVGTLFDRGAQVRDSAEDEEEAPRSRPLKRRSYRDEEEEMGALVEKKVKELLGKEARSGERHEPAAKPPAAAEAPPVGQPTDEKPKKRRIESIMGW